MASTKAYFQCPSHGNPKLSWPIAKEGCPWEEVAMDGQSSHNCHSHWILGPVRKGIGLGDTGHNTNHRLQPETFLKKLFVQDLLLTLNSALRGIGLQQHMLQPETFDGTALEAASRPAAPLQLRTLTHGNHQGLFRPPERKSP